MNLLILGRGKTGSLVADVARERGHDLAVLCSADNCRAEGLTPERLKDVAVVIDFTHPSAVVDNIHACSQTRTNMVVGTTGWYEHLGKVERVVNETGIGFLYSANFSVGVNLFFDAVEAAGAALRHRYSGQIFERHHAKKKDAPSGTAIKMQQIVKKASGAEVEIVSFREGEVVGMHEVVLESPNDRIYLCHDAKSRRGFAEGAVRAAEWLAGRKGFFDFKDVWRQL